MTSLSTLPPWITPTLPTSSPSDSPSTTTPSGLIIPGTTPAAAPAPGTTQTTTPSGLIVVRNELSQVSRGAKLVIADGPLEGNGAVEAAKAAHAELAAQHGAPAADVLMRDQLELAQQIRNDELRAQAVAALLAGDLAGAAKLISQQD